MKFILLVAGLASIAQACDSPFIVKEIKKLLSLEGVSHSNELAWYAYSHVASAIHYKQDPIDRNWWSFNCDKGPYCVRDKPAIKKKYYGVTSEIISIKSTGCQGAINYIVWGYSDFIKKNNFKEMGASFYNNQIVLFLGKKYQTSVRPNPFIQTSTTHKTQVNVKVTEVNSRPQGKDNQPEVVNEKISHYNNERISKSTKTHYENNDAKLTHEYKHETDKSNIHLTNNGQQTHFYSKTTVTETSKLDFKVKFYNKKGPFVEEEKKLIELLYIKRHVNKLPLINLSRKLTEVALIKSINTEQNFDEIFDSCLHNWAAEYACDSTKDNSCMWEKPKRLTGYKGYGFEIAFATTYPINATYIFKNFLNSTLHRDVILEQGLWVGSNWKAMGVSITQRTGNIWFGQEHDDVTL